MRNIPLKSVDNIARNVIALGTDYLPDTLLEYHSHRRAQFLYPATGLIEVSTAGGEWVIPPSCGVWIPPLIAHKTRMLNVSTRSLYIEPAAKPRHSADCEVLSVSPLLRQLLLEAADVPAEYDIQGRDGILIQLLLCELSRARPLPFFVPVPRDEKLGLMCREFMRRPVITSQPGTRAEKLHKSERSFSRFFRTQTGMSFSEWRQQACLLNSLSHILSGKSITEIAYDLGYNSAGAFSIMFKKQMGQSPSHFKVDDVDIRHF